MSGRRSEPWRNAPPPGGDKAEKILQKPMFSQPPIVARGSDFRKKIGLRPNTEKGLPYGSPLFYFNQRLQ